MLCFLIFADNLLRRIDGHEEMMWFGVNAGGIPSTLNTVAGHDGFYEFFDHTG
jgi:hypothetical protein